MVFEQKAVLQNTVIMRNLSESSGFKAIEEMNEIISFVI